MKYNPLTRRLFTNNGRLLKQLHCPFRVDWDDLAPLGDPTVRACDVCRHQITDTAMMDDQAVLALMTTHPDACLKVDFEQDNLIIIHRDATQP